MLQTLAASMRVIGSPIYNQTGWNNTPVLVVLGPEHAAEIVKGGASPDPMCSASCMSMRACRCVS